MIESTQKEGKDKDKTIRYILLFLFVYSFYFNINGFGSRMEIILWFTQFK